MDTVDNMLCNVTEQKHLHLDKEPKLDPRDKGEFKEQSAPILNGRPH